MSNRSLSLFFPCHNEADNLDALVREALEAAPALARAFELILVDDGSTDATATIAARLAAEHPGAADVVVGYRLHRADPLVRRIYAAIYRLANRIWFGLAVRDVDCAAKLFRSDSLTGLCVASDGAFFSAEMLIKLRARGVSLVEVGVPHYPRTAGSPTGARIGVILRAVRDFWSLRFALWLDRRAALQGGRALRA